MSWWTRVRSGLMAGLMLFASSPVIRAEDSIFAKPAATVTIAKLEKVKPDLTYLLRAVGVPEFGGLVTVMVDQYSKGLDTKRPAGVLVALDGPLPSAVAYLPLSDFEQLKAALSNIGDPPDELEDNKYALEIGANTVFAKIQGDWLYVAQDEGFLDNLPEDPSKFAQNPNDRYDIVTRVYVQNIPAETKSLITEQLKNAFEQGLEQADQSDEEKEAARKTGEQSIAEMERAIQELDQLVFGWSIDSSRKKTFMDFGAQAVEGSDLAKNMELQKGLTTNFSGFVLPGAAATFRVGTILGERDKKQAIANVDTAKQQILKQIDDSEDLSDDKAKEAVKEAVEKLIGLVEKTIKEGKFDGGATLALDGDKLRVILGGQVADGKQLAKDVQELVKQAEGNPDLPKFKFDAYEHKGVTFHTATAPLKSDDPIARKILGEELPLVVGTGEKSFFVGFGDGAEDLLKAILDQSSSKSSSKATPAEFSLQLSQILKFAQSVQPNSMLDVALETIADYEGKDRIEVRSDVIPRGIIYSFSVDEGVLRSVGAVARNRGNEEDN